MTTWCLWMRESFWEPRLGFTSGGGQPLCGGTGQAKTVKYAFLTGQAGKHDRQPKRREKGGPNAFLPKRLENITSSDLLNEIHHLGGTDHWHE